MKKIRLIKNQLICIKILIKKAATVNKIKVKNNNKLLNKKIRIMK